MSVKKVLFDMIMGIEIKEEVKKEKKSSGGIIIPDSVEEDSNDTGLKILVDKIGSTVEHIEVGDLVLIQPYGNNKVMIKGEEYYIFRENVAICVLDE